eukprot:CAMPEP_0197240666 /NCGR_PEP_ID=MMETSP1429-20130617/6888_1 /TAXON_ID=49237 /ORGANISM="Chaetoceros  sp., Strain UNC1202" /LENGTH=307 /DNA_ID=CAMNT_0042700349 /DNA_START=47 /DNA_END=970 /DNA_ORIENTATION=-
MKVTSAILALSCASTASAAFVPHAASRQSTLIVRGYLDDLSSELYKEDATPDVEGDTREANAMTKDQIDRFGPGNLNDFVDFEEFDGGDGQMGVAGDGTTGLDKSDFDTSELAQSMNKSRARSAKNAWGTSTGYADQLIEKGVDGARAQQLENWHNQREISKKKQEQRFMSEQFDQNEQNAEADWRTLAKFGVERNADFDMNDAFGQVSEVDGELEGTIELSARTGAIGYHEINLKNPYMGFADFRAALTGTSAAWSITPAEGSLTQKEATTFQLKFRPDTIGVSEGYLVIETEDFKKVWKVIGTTG